jgi:hypothetical protein
MTDFGATVLKTIGTRLFHGLYSVDAEPMARSERQPLKPRMSSAVPNDVEFSLSWVSVLPHLSPSMPRQSLKFSTNLA